MFQKATLQQISFLLRQKSVQFTFYLLLLIVLYSYFSAIAEFHGMDLLEMCGPVNLLSISWDRANYNQGLLMVITMLYPVLAVCPAGFSLAREKASGEQVFLAARMGYRSYHFSKLTAAFAVTALTLVGRHGAAPVKVFGKWLVHGRVPPAKGWISPRRSRRRSTP